MKKEMRKRLGLLAASGLALMMAVSGCGTPSQHDGKVTFTLWYWNDSLNDQVLASVHKAFPNVILKPEKIGGDFEAKLLSSMYADDAPDITAINSADFIATMVKDHDQFINLNQYPEVRQAEKEYLPWKWNLASTPDHKYQVAIPIDTGPTVLYYNATLFKKAGLPTDPAQVSKQLSTWAGYMAAARQLKQRTGVPMFDNIKTVYEAALNQAHQYYFTPAMKPIYAKNPAVKKAWNLAVEAHQEGLSANIDQWTTAWSSATAHNGFASFIGASWMVPQLQQSDPQNGVWRVAAAPGGPFDLGGSFVGITKNCKDPELAAQVVLWILNPKHQTKFYTTLGLYPSTPASFADPAMNQPSKYFGGENINQYMEASDKAIRIGFQSPYDGAVDGIFQQQLSEVELNGKNPNAAFNDAVNLAKQQLARELA